MRSRAVALVLAALAVPACGGDDAGDAVDAGSDGAETDGAATGDGAMADAALSDAGGPDAAAPTTVLRINEVNANVNQPSSCDLIELRVVTGGSLANFRLTERAGAVTELNLTFPAAIVAPNDLIVVHTNALSTLCNFGNATAEVTGPTQQPAATYGGNYDTAWDFWSNDSGLAATDNVLTLYSPTGAIVDALFASDDRTFTTAATTTESQAAIVGAANQWSPMMTSYVGAVFRQNAVEDLNATGSTVTGASIQRLDNTDDNNVADWNTGGPTPVLVRPHSFGLINLGQTPF